MSDDTGQFRRVVAEEWKIKQIAGAAILSIGAAIVGGTTVWAFLQTQFAPNRLTEYRLDEQAIHVEKLEAQVKQLEEDNHNLRIIVESIKK